MDINDYFSRLSLVDLTDQGLLLSMPNKNILRNINLTAPYSQATVANLMLVGAGKIVVYFASQTVLLLSIILCNTHIKPYNLEWSILHHA